ncbi:MAG: aldo/keto reductase, partial [Gloeomargaritaceae cyanobacterium C42_A2020_066]|nr:aldo/keto reductase [Gloeomargaritaceae cyanobacterium C42_A2020_066]
QHKWQDQPPEAIPAENQANLEAILARALSLGINHIETARGYGTSEMQLGYALGHFPRPSWILQTKVAPKADPQAFAADFEKSLHYLQVDQVDLLAFHGLNLPEHWAWTRRPGGCLEMARQWQCQGRVRFIGFSTHGPTDLITAIINSGEFDYVNLHWYYINQRNWPAVEAAAVQDMGVFIISPSDKGGRLYDPPEKLVNLCQPLSPMVFNDLFCLSHPQVHTLSLGAARPADFEEHLRTLPLLDQAANHLAPILRRLDHAGEQALGRPWLETWDEGLPDYTQVPGEVNIRTILWLYNLVCSLDLWTFARDRYNLLGQGSHWFPGQRADALDTLNLNTCLAASPHREQIPPRLAQTHQWLTGPAGRRLSHS